MTEEMVAFLSRVQEVLARRFPRCRDCADDGPICPNSGLPCDLDSAFRAVTTALSRSAADRGQIVDDKEARNVLRQVKEATYIGIHKGNYGLRHYLSAEQKTLVENALVAALSPAPAQTEE